MKRVLLLLSTLFVLLLTLSALSLKSVHASIFSLDSIRAIYARPSSLWPKPTIDKGVIFEELGILPSSPIDLSNDSIQRIVKLGKTLFFDPRLSGSDQISCSTCHMPNLNWTDGLKVSVGHGLAQNTRNAPSIENVWFNNSLFWDGRAKNLEEQAQIPLTSEIEMHQDMKILPKKLGDIKGYKKLFKKAYGDDKVTTERIFGSLALFQKTVISAKTPFDRFLEGDKNSLTAQQLQGLHLFRTKARCMNCHHGPLFTDNDFHNLGLANYGKANQDLGLYNATKNPKDSGKFKTPSLRNVMKTGPWFHDGSVKTIDSLMELYNMGMLVPAYTLAQMDDPLLPKNDRLLRGIRLSKTEIKALVSFLEAISVAPIEMKIPVLPR